MNASLDLTPYKALVKERCGLLFEGNNADKLARALDERMEAVGANGAAYYAQLRASEAEFQELVNLLTINETYFFREPEQLRLLVDRLLPRLLERCGDGRPLRILSAGCSSGEEPYSLALALCEKYGDACRRMFELHGGDIDSAVLARARHGRYGEFSFRAFPAPLRERYFVRDGSHWLLRDDIRRQVEFREINLSSPELAAQLRQFDVVLFRNVSIYFDEPTRRSIQRNLATLLKDDGILMTGIAETLANDFGILALVEEEGQFYFVNGRPPAVAAAPVLRRVEASPQPASEPPRTATKAPPRAAATPPRPVAPAVPSAPVAPASAPADAERLARLTREHRYDEALPLLEQRLAADARDIAALLLKSYILIERKEFDAAETTARAVVESDPWSVDALLLLGLAARWRGDADAAIRHFKQAVYARQDCWLAHFHLADLYRGADAADLARREYRIVLQLLGGEAPDCGVRTIPLGLSASEAVFLSRHRLAKFDDSAVAR